MNREKPNCYQCKHIRNVPGSAHNSCGHPTIEKSSGGEVAAIFASVGRLPGHTSQAGKLNVKGNPTGIKKGWFNWPYNFDPTWLESCDGFEDKEVATPKSK